MHRNGPLPQVGSAKSEKKNQEQKVSLKYK